MYISQFVRTAVCVSEHENVSIYPNPYPIIFRLLKEREKTKHQLRFRPPFSCHYLRQMRARHQIL